MVYFENHAWQVLIKFEKVAGIWPYQKKTTNWALRILSSSLIFSVSVTLIIRLVKEWNINLQIVIENVVALLLTCGVMTKLISTCLVENRRREIYEQVATHFEILVEDDEANILNNYAKEGLTFGIKYTVFLATAAGLYDILPIMRMYMLYLLGHGNLEKKFPLYVDYLIDEQEYYFYMLVHLLISLGIGMTIQFAFDLTFFLLVKHASALFDIVKLRVRKASEIFEQCDENNKLLDSDEAKAYGIISSAVDLHNEALELSCSIDETYRCSWFIILLLNTIILTPLPALAMLYKDDSFELFRACLTFPLFIVHFYVIYLQGQTIIDSSSSVFDTCNEFYWYNASKRSRVAISLMKRRCFKPCVLTGGNIFVLCMETYCVMMKSTLSYISMFAALDW